MQNEQVSIAKGWAAVEEARRARGGFGRGGGGVRELGSEEFVRGLGSRSGGLTARPVGLGGAGRPTVMLGDRAARTNANRQPMENLLHHVWDAARICRKGENNARAIFERVTP